MKEALTDRQQEIYDLLKAGNTPTETGRKAKPPISANAVHMTIRRIEAKGHTVKVAKSKRGPKAKPQGRRTPARPEPPGNPPEVVSGSELIARINSGLKEDIDLIEGTIASNEEAKTAAEALVKRLTEENATLSTQKEKLEAIAK